MFEIFFNNFFLSLFLNDTHTPILKSPQEKREREREKERDMAKGKLVLPVSVTLSLSLPSTTFFHIVHIL